MPQFRSLPSFHHGDADVIEEPLMQAVPVSQPLKLKAFATVSTDQLVQSHTPTHYSQEPNTDSLTHTPAPFADAIQQAQPVAYRQPVTPFVTRELSDSPFATRELSDSPFVTRELSDSPFATRQLSDSPFVTRQLSPGREDEIHTGPMTGQRIEQISPQLASNMPIFSLVPIQTTGQQTPSTFAAVSSPSLITALQSTMGSHKKTDQMVVIPATMKRTQVLPETVNASRRMPRRFRHAIALGLTLMGLILTLLSLAPLDDGQSTYHIFASAAQWGTSSQQNWDISAHTIGQMPGNGGANSSTSSTAMNVNTGNLPNMDLPTSQYVAIAQQDAIAAGISPDYFVRQIYAESSFDPNAYSPAGAVGIAQFEPATAYGLGIDPYDPISALKGAAQLMASYNTQYNGNYAMALSAYNAGGGNVQIAVQNCGANWLSCMPAETQNYVYKIMGI
ncbi:MAG TPA: hypothetical protein DHW02_03460 [Ktedonobacter sp.]|nr:hypothetical protein [Ktedonobacter sp.]